MKIFLISNNDLFTETVCSAFTHDTGTEIIPLKPGLAADTIIAAHPEVILIDESGTDSIRVNEILATTRSLPNSRAVLLSLRNNEVIVLKSHRETIRNVEDLLESIQTVDTDQMLDLVTQACYEVDVYSFLAFICNQAPDQQLIEQLRTLASNDLLNLAGQVEENNEIQNGLIEISDFISDMAGLDDKQLIQLLSVDWTRLFRGVRPGYGPPPPYEDVYIGGNDLKALQSVADYYQEHGVEASPAGNNRPDYIGLELEFLRHVSEKKVDALKKGDSSEARNWRSVEQDFLENHIGRWVAAFCDRAIPEAQTAFYRGALRLMCGMVGEQ